MMYVILGAALVGMFLDFLLNKTDIIPKNTAQEQDIDDDTSRQENSDADTNVLEENSSENLESEEQDNDI